jgi:hypothetical protein
MKKLCWTDHVRNEEVLQRVKGEGNILQTIKRRKSNWTGHILRRYLPSKTCYRRKGGGKERSDGKKRKKT